MIGDKIAICILKIALIADFTYLINSLIGLYVYLKAGAMVEWLHLTGVELFRMLLSVSHSRVSRG